MPGQENLSKNSKAMFKAMSLALQPTTKALSAQTAILNKIALTSQKQTQEEAFKDNKARKVEQETEKKQTGFLKGIFEKGKKSEGILGFIGKHWGKILIGIGLLLTPISKLLKGFRWLKELWTENSITQMGKWIGAGILAAWGIKSAVGLTLTALLKALFWPKKKPPTPDVPDKKPKTTTTDPEKPKTKTTETKRVKPKQPIKRTPLGKVAKIAGPVAGLVEVGGAISDALQNQLDRVKARKGDWDEEQIKNIGTRTPLKATIREGMEDNVKMAGDVATGFTARVLGAPGDLLRWIDPEFQSKMVILKNSDQIKKSLDAGVKAAGKSYVDTVKKTSKALQDFTKKEIKDTQKPPVSSDPVVQRLLKQQQQQEEKEKKSGWFHSLGNKLGDWGDKQYKRFVQPAVQAAAKFQKISTTPSQGRVIKSMKDKINWAKISEYEGGRKLKGYVPEPDKSDSGVTIATGFDLGARGPHDLLGLSPKLRAKLTPYLGFKKHAAEAALRELGPLTITAAEATEIDKFSKGQAVSNLRKEWNERAKELGPSAKRFDELNSAQQTVAASVAFQYGSLSRTPDFRKFMQTGNWKGAVGELRNFGDAYKSRRKDEAMYLEASLHGANNFKHGYNVTPTMGQHLGGNVTNIYKGGDTNSSSTPMMIAQVPNAGDSNADQINNSMNKL